MHVTIGILAQMDAGKTMLSERILFRRAADPAALLDYLENYDETALDVRHLKSI